MKLKSVLLALSALAALPGCAHVAMAQEAAATSEVVAARPDFSGVWQLADAARVVLPEWNGEFTPEARANLEHFRANYHDEDADPAIKVCLAKGMPWTSLIRARDYPVEIYQTEDRIFMLFELYDQYRTIRINGAPKPENYPDGPNGYSVAHWEGEELVIETTGLIPLNPIGPNQRGSSATITERWRLADDPEHGQLLVVDLIQDDPEVYVTPAHGHNEMRRAAPDVVVGGYGCSASLWDQHVAQMEERLAAGQDSAE